jgi:putative DNA primase/helicase
VDGAELLDGIATAVRAHVVMSNHCRDACALWLLHTYLVDRFLISPRLGIRSPTKGCGKTLLLDVLGRLVARPLPTASVTPAAIFRVVEAHRPTLLIDEADTFLYDNDELRGVLNGNRKGSTVLRTVGDDHEPRAFSVYSACAIALIGALPDTLHDRAVTIDLQRRRPNETITPYRPDRADHLDVLARKAARWAQDHAERIGETDPAMPDGIINRAADNWRPLLAIADQAGGEWATAGAHGGRGEP